MKSFVLEIGDDGCGLLEFDVPADATDDEPAYLESLVPRLDPGLLELFDPATGELVFSCRPELVREPTSSAVLAIH